MKLTPTAKKALKDFENVVCKPKIEFWFIELLYSRCTMEKRNLEGLHVILSSF